MAPAKISEAEALSQIVDRSTAGPGPALRAVMSGDDLRELQAQTRAVVLADHVKRYAVQLVLATHPDQAPATESVRRFVRHGASPRGLLAMILTAKAFALFAGRLNVSFADLRAAAAPALRHRILLNFEGEAEGVAVDDIVEGIVEAIAVNE